ncbi:MAG: helix-hairpin-helix domain-containing protein [Cytophagales bacterium]|nr:helix-hairpin-helix domain-containing protein [Cytophagales bacterium]
MKIRKLPAIYLLLFLLISVCVYPQSPRRPDVDMDAFIQNIFDQQTDNVPYEDVYESLFQFYRYPLDLNKATRDDLQDLFLLSPVQVEAFLKYREQNGKLLSMYEIQAIPGFDKATIDKLLPFVKVQDDGIYKDARGLLKRMYNEHDNHYLIMRYQQTLEQQKGFAPDAKPSQKFLGSPEQLFARYRVYQKNDFSFGITTKKDVGEQLAWNPDKKQYGMDFYSAHLTLYNIGKIKCLALGDYQLMIGQGLASSAGFYRGKGAEPVLTAKRSNQGLRPYTSAMEFNYYRGAAITYALHKTIDFTAYYSNRAVDANVIKDTTDLDEYTSTIFINGLHRTDKELQGKGALNEQISGQYLQYNSVDGRLKIGLSSIYTWYDNRILRNPTLTTIYDFSGSNNLNLGADFSYVFQNFNFFGEINRSKSGGVAALGGFIASLHPTLDMALSARSYDVNYHAFYSNAFREQSLAQNERGIYWGVKYMPIKKLNFAGSFDRFEFPWLISRADAPTEGYEYRIRVNFMPTKKITLYAQYVGEVKQLNAPNRVGNTDVLSNTHRRNYLINLDYKAEKLITLKTRIQFSDFRQEMQPLEQGIVALQDVNFDFGKFRISTRFAIFDAQDYNVRIYVFEKNVLYAFAMPLYYGQGVRNYILLQYKINRQTDVWLRVAQFNYRNQDNISSGLNEIDGSTKTDVTLQVKYDF